MGAVLSVETLVTYTVRHTWKFSKTLALQTHLHGIESWK